MLKDADAAMPVVQNKINGCHVTLLFVAEPAEDVADKIKAILSNAYEERVEKELMELASLKQQ